MADGGMARPFPGRCTQERHNGLRRHPIAAASALAWGGMQRTAPDDVPMVLVHCRECGSTLAVLMHYSEAASLWVEMHARPGVVLWDADKRVPDELALWLPAALSRAHLAQERVPGGWRICASRPDDEPTHPGPVLGKRS